ncbi:MAG: tetratricopeptide repeat protein [Myxococcales bacterium]|nr:tetratricopeptide repeat protein [Myxococcales bacterium]
MEEKLAAIIREAYDALFGERLAAVRSALDRAKRLDAGSGDVALLEIELLDASGDDDEALAAAEAALEAFPASMAIRLKLATILLDGYDADTEAREHLEQLFTRIDSGEAPGCGSDGEDTARAKQHFVLEVLLALADARAACHDLSGALSAAERATKLAPEDSFAPVAMSQVLLALGRAAEAERLIEQTLERDPRNPDAHDLRGHILTARGDQRGAYESFARAAAFDGKRFKVPVGGAPGPG